MATQPSLAERYGQTREAFDSVAAGYDGPSGNNVLVQHMRAVMWHVVHQLAAPGSRLLDLGCGAGLDALHFAQRGYHVTAIDASPAMVAQTRHRALLDGKAVYAGHLTTMILGIQELDRRVGERFDVIYSDLGALNCLPELDSIARVCEGLLAPGGFLVFSVIGRYCPWEAGYYLLHGDARRAAVRMAPGQVAVSLNGHTAWTRYYTPHELLCSFRPMFVQHSCRAINLLLPPPYMLGFYSRHRTLFKLLAWIEQRVATLPGVNQFGDHFLMVMRRHA